jgi:hypothetical protein
VILDKIHRSQAPNGANIKDLLNIDITIYLELLFDKPNPRYDKIIVNIINIIIHICIS